MLDVKMSLSPFSKTVFKKIPKINNKVKSAVSKTFRYYGKLLEKYTVDLINKKPKHGRIYKIRIGIGGKSLKRISRHISSAAGEAPAVITGKLRASIDYKIVGSMTMHFGSFGTDYAKYLEYADIVKFSGQGSSKIEPRPFISASYKIYEKPLAHDLELNCKKAFD